MTEQIDTMQVLTSWAKHVTSDIAPDMPLEVLKAILFANNQILKAAIIENGGTLTISPDSVYEMLQNRHHVVAEATDDGFVTLSLAAKEDIASAKHDLVPL